MTFLELDNRQRADMGLQLAALSQPAIGLKYFRARCRIEPRGDALRVHILDRSAPRGQHALRVWLWNDGADPFDTGINQKAVRLEVRTEAVIAAPHGVESCDQLFIDAAALQQSFVGPGG